MTLRYSFNCSYFCESDSLCSPVDLDGNSASVISWVSSHLLRTAQDTCASVGPEPGILTGPLLCLLTVCKVASLLFQAGGWPWNLPLFLGHSALEGFKMPLTAAFLAEYHGPRGLLSWPLYPHFGPVLWKLSLFP